MAYESFYEGGYSALDPEYGRNEGDIMQGLKGVRVHAGSLSMATDPRTANQIADVTTKLNTGVKNIEVSTITPEVFESIPEQHLKEINRISKLTGAEISVHGLLVEPSGITQQGFSEVQREGTERQMIKNVERASQITPGGVITFHSTSGVPDTEEVVMVKEDGRLVSKTRGMWVIDPRTGKMAPIRDVAERYFPIEGEEFTGKPISFNPEKQLDKINEESWRNELREVNFAALRGAETLPKEGLLNEETIRKLKAKEIKFEDFGTEKDRAREEFYVHEHGAQFLQSAYREMRDLFDRAYQTAQKSGNEDAKEKLGDFAKKLLRDRDKIEDPKKFDAHFLAETVREGINLLGEKEIGAPGHYVKLHDFVLEKSSQTFGDVAWQTYNNLKEKAPIISIENPPAGSGFSRAEDIKALIEASRDKFVENAVKQGYSDSEAQKIAEKMIGATWDVGHINMLRKYGYTDKELVEQTKKIAPFVKHVHLSDNFGMDHTELPMGMGNVPFKQELEVLKKAGFKGKQVIEVGNWWQHFKTPPLGEVMDALGSPLYSMRMDPYWNQMRATYGHYFMGFGPTLPEQHFSMYGGGFSALPQELGGQIPGKQSRFSGTPNE